MNSPWNSLGQNTGVGSLSLLSPEDLPNPGMELRSATLQVDSLVADPKDEKRSERERARQGGYGERERENVHRRARNPQSFGSTLYMFFFSPPLGPALCKLG